MSDTRIQKITTVVDNRQIAEDIYELVLSGSGLAQASRPGQFVMLSVADGIEPFLRRPFSIAGMDKATDTIRIIYQTVGKGTDRMQDWRAGVTVDVLGPLGNGFSWDDGLERAILAGGGLGIAAILPLAEALRVQGIQVDVFLGARSSDMLFGVSELEVFGCCVQVATEDGSSGVSGFVTLPLEEHLRTHLPSVGDGSAGQPPGHVSLAAQHTAAGDPARSQMLFACGPAAFLHAVSDLCAAYQLSGQLSMEERMGCGFGACMGCSIEVYSQDAAEERKADEHQGYRRKRVCKDGPVFPIGEVVFHG